HEGNCFGGGEFGGNDQVTLVFAVLVVCDDNRLTCRDDIDGLLNGGEFHFSSLVLNWSIRATWRARMSVSKLTTSPISVMPSVVASSVSGMRKISNQCCDDSGSVTSATVSEIPLTVMDPWSIRYGANRSGRLIRMRVHCSPGSISLTVAVDSTCPCTMWPPKRSAAPMAGSTLTLSPVVFVPSDVRRRVWTITSAVKLLSVNSVTVRQTPSMAIESPRRTSVSTLGA